MFPKPPVGDGNMSDLDESDNDLDIARGVRRDIQREKAGERSSEKVNEGEYYALHNASHSSTAQL